MTVVQDRTPTRVIRGGRGPMGPAGTGLRAWQTKTADYTAVDGDRLVLDSSAGGFTLTLPAAGGELWLRGVGDAWTTHAVTLNGNGRTIDGAATQPLDGEVAGFLVHLISQGGVWTYDLNFLNGAA